MSALNWGTFKGLPGAVDANFERLCRMLIRRHYGRYGDFSALAQQPGIEFDLKLNMSCPLGEPGRWYGWQCRWYDLASGQAIGQARRTKIEKAIRTTESTLPNLTDWVLWTRRPLTAGDQAWFKGIATRMRLHLWTAVEAEEHLSGPAEILRGTYFGELVLAPETLSDLHDRAVAPIRRRWQPEVHQSIATERTLRRMLGETGTWGDLQVLADQLHTDAAVLEVDRRGLATGPLALAAAELVEFARAVATTLRDIHTALNRGDLDLLRQQLADRPATPSSDLAALPRRLRASRQLTGLIATNALADVRSARTLLQEVRACFRGRLVAVVAQAGCGKTELAAQLTATADVRPAGILLHGGDLHAGHSLDNLANRVVIQGTPVPTMEALVAAIDSAAQRAHRRLPIVIDGLNEAEDPRDWKGELATLAETLAQYPYVLVVCTVRTDFADEALPDVHRLEIFDFGYDIVAAVRRYFAYYKINAADAELPWEMLQHPLTLRLFCEVTNPTREDVVGIERMPGSLTALFDRYLKQAAERISELAPGTRRYYEQDVRAALNKIGVALWEAKARSLDFAELRSSLEDEARPWNESLVWALEQDGVLRRLPGDAPSRDHEAVLYDSLAGHVVADSLLARLGWLGLDKLLRDPAIIDVFAGPLPDQHPLATDILRALVGLLPRRLHGQQLWPLLNEPLRSVALRGAADLEGDYLDAATINELRVLVVQPPTAFRDLFERLRQTRAVPQHPLNAEFLDAVLRPMSVADRDLRWSEWVRRNSAEVLTDLQRLERRWRSNLERSSADLYRAWWVMWTLTSTIHVLRDQATRTLYWFGRGNPVALFDLSLRALTINDPYVFERMLAASYGVAMALQYNIDERDSVANALADGAERLYAAMFATGAPHATTHWLARNYARRTIEIAVRLRPDMLTAAQLDRMRPPYEGGIRDWGESEDKNEGEYRDGNHPFGLLDDDPMDLLGPGISKYRSDTPQYKEAKANLWWRIYDLGYSLERCGSIDSLLANHRPRPASGADSSSVDGYGRKYCWIATCELAGCRDDLALLRSEWESKYENWTHVDLDPSFPEELTKHQLVHGDLLGNPQTPLAAWIGLGPDLTFEELCEIEEIDGERGPWILLSGYITQQDKPNGRHMFCFSLGSLVEGIAMETLAEVVAKARRVEVDRMDVPDTHYTYAGEIPWCETYPANEASPVSIITEAIPTEPSHAPTSTTYILTMPITGHGWESYHSELNPSTGAQVPARQIADLLKLTSRPQTFDLYDPEGRRASVSFEYGEPFSNRQHFTYLRKDLLNQYLAKRGQHLIWVIYGERSAHFAGLGKQPLLGDGPPYVRYEKVRMYNPGKAP